MNSVFAVHNDGTYLPQITRKTCSSFLHSLGNIAKIFYSYQCKQIGVIFCAYGLNVNLCKSILLTQNNVTNTHTHTHIHTHKHTQTHALSSQGELSSIETSSISHYPNTSDRKENIVRKISKRFSLNE